jgi:cathepsin X
MKTRSLLLPRWILGALIVPVSVALFLLSTTLSTATGGGYELENELVYLPGHVVYNDFELPLPHTYLDRNDLPESFSWGNVQGKSFITQSLNQHLPQWCGSCWAHGALSSLADRIKIAQTLTDSNRQFDDINLSIQFVLNCGADVAGSCHGGSHTGTYEFIKSVAQSIPYVTCQPYLACSSDSTFGFCPYVDTTCPLNSSVSLENRGGNGSMNVCRTCNVRIDPWHPKDPFKTECSAIETYPNATIAEYGSIRSSDDDDVVFRIKAEIFARGPVAATVNGQPLHTYHGGVFNDTTASKKTTHIVSIIGWGRERHSKFPDATKGQEYWIIRNSWGQFWGELGFARIGPTGYNVLGIESHIAWATPGQFTVINYPCILSFG